MMSDPGSHRWLPGSLIMVRGTVQNPPPPPAPLAPALPAPDPDGDIVEWKAPQYP